MSIQQIVFLIVVLLVARFAVKSYSRIYRNIRLGKDLDLVDDDGTRWKNVLLVAFGQKKMFKRWIPAVLHLFIYVAFLFTQIELIEILLDGIFGVHRFFAPYLGPLYSLTISSIEVLSVLALIATLIFLARRNLLKIPRFRKSEMTGWPYLDANLILLGELALVTGIFMMNGADVVLQSIDPAHYPDTGYLAVSSTFGPLAFDGLGKNLLQLIERSGWWLHVLTVFLFICYLPFSKHLHIFFAFPNTFFSKLKPRGEMSNMPAIMNEVKSMMGLTEEVSGDVSEELPEFGANDIAGLSWRNVLNAYTCTECGRCTDVCPANLTGKKLSPRKVMMDIRDRAEEIGQKLDSKDSQFIKNGSTASILTAENFDDGKSLFDYITREEIHACTACNACVEACPVLIDPLEPILEMRRYEILTESAGPADWVPMFTSLENSGSVWAVQEDRVAWIDKE